MTRPPRIVFFGPPAAGTSQLSRAVRDRSPAALTDVAGPQAGELFAAPDRLASAHPAAGDVRAADAVVLTLSADDPDPLDLFRAFDAFLETLEETRTFGREVGGLPVFLTLTKCDLLWKAGDDPAEWEARVRTKLTNVRREFEDFLAEETGHTADPLAFGSLAVATAATAMKFPADPRFAGLAGPYGVADLAERATAAAEAHAGRAADSRRRLRWTLGGSGAILTALLLGLLTALAAGTADEDRLLSRVRRYMDGEGTAAVRLSDRRLPRNRAALVAVRDDYQFAALPDEWQRFVLDRLREMEAYTEYRERFVPPRLGPAEVRSLPELTKLETDLTGELAPPAEFAAAWTDTEAVRLWAKWRADADLLRQAQAELTDWYRELIRRGTGLLLGPSLDAGWRGQAQELLARAANPPRKPTDTVPGSLTVPIRRGTPLTYAAALDFDRVDQARFDWTDTRDRLTALRDLSDALGLTPGRPAALDVPEPTADRNASRRLAADRLRLLDAEYRRTAENAGEWNTSHFPDPVRSELQRRLRVVFDAGVRHVHGLILERRGPESIESWKPIPDWLEGDSDLLAWGRFLRLIARWADPDVPREDPVQELAAFLRRDAFAVSLPSIELILPEDLRDRRVIPAGPLVLTHNGTEYRFRADGEAKRDGRTAVYRLVPDGHPGAFVFRPGEAVSAALPVRAGDAGFRLEWTGGRSTVYAFGRLTSEPVLRRDGSGTAEPAAGVRLAAAGLPALPVLVP